MFTIKVYTVYIFGYNLALFFGCAIIFIAGRTVVLDKRMSRSPMLQPYVHPTKRTVAQQTQQTRKSRYLQRYAALPDKEKREHQLVMMTLIAEAIVALRREGEAVTPEQRL